MPFGVVSAFGRGMGVLDGVETDEGEGAVLGLNVRHGVATRLFSNYFVIACFLLLPNINIHCLFLYNDITAWRQPRHK